MLFIQLDHLSILIKNIVIFVIHQITIFIHFVDQLIFISHVDIYSMILLNMTDIIEIHLVIIIIQTTNNLLIRNSVRFS